MACRTASCGLPWSTGLNEPPLTRLPLAVRNAERFRRVSGISWPDLIREGLAMRHGQEVGWSQLLMAANTPMLLRAAMVDGRPDLGLMSSGQVVGVINDLPAVGELIDRIVAEATDTLAKLPRLAGSPVPGTAG